MPNFAVEGKGGKHSNGSVVGEIDAGGDDAKTIEAIQQSFQTTEMLKSVPGIGIGHGHDAPAKIRKSVLDWIVATGSFVRHSSTGTVDMGEHAPVQYFIDASAVKERVRANLMKPKYDVTEYYKETCLFKRLATSVLLEQITLSVIAVNAVWIAIDTDMNNAAVLLNAHPVFIVAENAFCTFFLFEILVRFMAFRNKCDCLKDAWFVFDSCLVASMVLETWIMTLFALLAGGGGGNTLGGTGIIRVARLLRLSRMARMARLLRAMPELMIMIKGMLAATRSVFCTFCLLVLIMYVFAIAMVQLTKDTDIGSAHFKNVPSSMFTLWMHGTLLDDVGTVTVNLGDEATYMAIVFMVFVLLAALTVMNMLIGVLCEVVSVVAALEKEEMLCDHVTGVLQKVVTLVDSDGDAKISRKEFHDILENHSAVRCLSDVGVDVVGLVDFADFIFEGDENGEGQISFAKFTDVVLQLRGSNNATVKDIVDLRKFVRNAMMNVHSELRHIRVLINTWQSNLIQGGQSCGSPTLAQKSSGKKGGHISWKDQWHSWSPQSSVTNNDEVSWNVATDDFAHVMAEICSPPTCPKLSAAVELLCEEEHFLLDGIHCGWQPCEASQDVLKDNASSTITNDVSSCPRPAINRLLSQRMSAVGRASNKVIPFVESTASSASTMFAPLDRITSSVEANVFVASNGIIPSVDYRTQVSAQSRSSVEVVDQSHFVESTPQPERAC